MRHFSSGSLFEPRETDALRVERPAEPRSWWPRPLTFVVAAGTGLVLVIALITGLLVSDSRTRAIEGKERELANLAMVLATETDRAFKAIELVQTSLVEQMRSLAITSGEDYRSKLSTDDLHRILKDKISGLPYVQAISILTGAGETINSSQPRAETSPDGYGYLRLDAVPATASASLFVSEPLREPGKPWIVHVARRFDGPKGELLGLVVGAVDLAYFETFFGTIALEPNSAIALFRRDGTLLARHPHVDSLIGRNFGPDTGAVALLKQSDRGVRRQTGAIYGEDRIIAAQATGYPIVVTASTTTAAALAEWRRQAATLSSAGIALVLVVTVVIVLICRQLMQRQRRAKAAIWDQKLQLDAALNNMRHALLMFDGEGRLVLYNQRFLEMYKLSADTVTPGCTLTDLLRLRKAAGTFRGDPEKYMAKLANEQGLFEGDPDRRMAKLFEAGKVETKVTELPDGRSIYIINSSMPGGGWVSTHEDVTERRQIETERNSSQEILNLILERVPVPIYVKDAVERRYLMVNRAGEEFWGIPRNEMLGKTAYDVFSRKEANSITSREHELLRSGKMLVDERAFETPRNGRREIVSSRLVLYDGRGLPSRIVGVIEDVTERRQFERQRSQPRTLAAGDAPSLVEE
jgi:PAS domain S-box-containing protein